MLQILWATPRTVSTAFERMMIERGDHLVLDEPWSRAYYFGPERRSDRYPLVFPESSYDAVSVGVSALAAREPVFVKDMAYQALPGVTDDLLRSAVHTFLVRDPHRALASLEARWPDFTADEAGYAAQHTLFDRVSALGCRTAVLDSDRLRAAPHDVIARWCARVGLDVDMDALEWEPGLRPEWQLWRGWYERVATTTGFEPPADDASPALSERTQRLADDVSAGYEILRSHAL